MSSETLERALGKLRHCAKVGRPVRGGVTLYATTRLDTEDCEALLAEVARLEQERESVRRWGEDQAQKFREETLLSNKLAADLAVARERAEKAEQERDEALRLVTMMRATESTALAVAREREQRATERLEQQLDEATLAEPDSAKAETGRKPAASGSASAAADEPGETQA